MSAEDQDASILAGLKAGEDEAWSRAFRKLWPVALHAAHHPEVILSIEEAEDAANEALAQVVGQVEKVATFLQLKALVAAIAYRRAVSLSRRKYASKRHQGLPAGFTLSEFEKGASSDPAAQTARLSDQDLAELTLLLGSLLAELDDTTRTLVVGKIAQGTSYAELSQRHGLPLGTVCAKVARALKRLRLILRQSPALVKEFDEFLR